MLGDAKQGYRLEPGSSSIEAFIGTTTNTWIGTPHFYLSGDTIATYVSNNVDVIQSLESAFGPQFEGGSVG